MGRSYVVGRGAAVLGTFVAVLATLALLAPGAGAVLVNFGHGQVAGVTPIKGVNPTSIPGSYAKRSGSVNPFSANGDLDYHGGPVLHGSAPYLIFWDPSSAIPAGEETLLERYFADSAADSGGSTNVFGVDRQFTDGTGFADYNMSWVSSHAITDTDAYPTTGNCTEHASGFTETTCLFDNQLQAEVQHVVTTDGLPTGLTGNAPIYELVTPSTVNSCFGSTPPGSQCADNAFCAYHSGFAGTGGGVILYANLPTLLAAQAPKECQDDGNGGVQSPNSNPTADVVTKYMSHETNETITDPLGNAWFISTGCVPNTTSPCGNEDGDNCNFFASTPNPFLGNSPNAFEPTLGGTAAGDNLFDQVINGNDYYTQTEWSNGNVNCEAQPAAATLSPAFTVPSGTAAGSPATFDPSASTSTAGYTSETWNFGDGTSSFAATTTPTSQSHIYSANGNFTVTLTMVDTFGNVSTVSHAVSIHSAAVPALGVTTTTPVAGSPVAFNGSGSSEPGGSITGYSWNFGDGSNGTGATTAHTYAHAGTYTVTLTVTDGFGSTASASKTVVVLGVPMAKLTVQTAHPVVGGTTAFSGASSTDTGSAITSYSWRFGDGGTGSGPSVTHRYTKPGAYNVTLTIADASRAGSAVATVVRVKNAAAGIASVSVKTGKKVEQVKFKLGGAGTLKIGPKKFKIKHAESFTFKYKLSKSQLKKLHPHHSLTIKLKATFTPSAGKPSSRTITIKVMG